MVELRGRCNAETMVAAPEGAEKEQAMTNELTCNGCAFQGQEQAGKCSVCPVEDRSAIAGPRPVPDRRSADAIARDKARDAADVEQSDREHIVQQQRRTMRDEDRPTCVKCGATVWHDDPDRLCKKCWRKLIDSVPDRQRRTVRDEG